MNRSRRQDGFNIRRHLLVVMTVGIGMVLGTQAAAGKECHRETPLPADVRLIAPGAEVPEAFVRFAGVWTGEWEHSGGLCQTLVVEEVFANGYARVISGGGTSATWNIQLPGFFRATGRIGDGVLRFHGPGRDRPEFAYRVAGETLSGTYKGEGDVRLGQVADVRQVGCGQRVGELPPAPPASGPRDRLTAAEILTSAGGTSRQTGSFAARGMYGTTGGSTAPSCTARARPLNWSCKTDSPRRSTNARPATRKAIELLGHILVHRACTVLTLWRNAAVWCTDSSLRISQYLTRGLKSYNTA